MLTPESSRQIQAMELIAWKGIKVIDYFEIVTGEEGRFFIIVQHSLGESACLHWAHLFAKRSDDLHYSNFFDRPDVRDCGSQFRVEEVKARMLRRIEMNDLEYESFWTRMNDIRDQYIAHRDLSNLEPLFPDLRICREMLMEFRDVLSELVELGRRHNSEDPVLELLERRFHAIPNAMITQESRDDVEMGIDGFNAWWHVG
jgi:hypothetical protein